MKISAHPNALTYPLISQTTPTRAEPCPAASRSLRTPTRERAAPPMSPRRRWSGQAGGVRGDSGERRSLPILNSRTAGAHAAEEHEADDEEEAEAEELRLALRRHPGRTTNDGSEASANRTATASAAGLPACLLSFSCCSRHDRHHGASRRCGAGVVITGVVTAGHGAATVRSAFCGASVLIGFYSAS